jgi:hypothetical protein
MQSCSVDIKKYSFPSLSTNIFQSLNLSHFGMLKKIINRKLPLDNDSSSEVFIKHIFHNMKQTLRNTGLRHDIDIDVDSCLSTFDECVLDKRQSQSGEAY